MDDRPKFKVAVVYEDGAAGRRAKHFYDKVFWKLIEECEFDLELWNFQFLAIGNWSARFAAQVDLVILSMHGKTELPKQTRNWIERWCRRQADCKPTLVLLLDQIEAKGSKSPGTLGYLRSLAAHKGISFYSHTTF